ncbi:MAG: family 10 glycosylhydrolase [Candidatus Marinimicrobia bacterium]|nr:family 10 glycosylhydrolase [Candidatus Neomarinimicrobiota bacterium]
MKKTLTIILLICLLTGAVFAENNREWRAIWSITWNQFSSSASTEALKLRADAILDKHVEAGMNAVLWQVRQGGTVYYPSAIEPWGSYIGYTDPGYDPLAYAIEEAHKRGLELHAWFNTFHCSSTITGAAAQVHPEWVCRDGYGTPMPQSRSLSPGLKAVRDYTVSLVTEIVANYDIDGIHFDYVRWNEYDNGDFSVAAAKYAEEHDLPDGVLAPGMEEYLQKQELDAQSNRAPMVPSESNRFIFDINHPESAGIPDSTDLFPDATPGVQFASWGDWRRGATNVFIKTVHDTVQQMKPWVKVSPAAIGRHKAGGWNGYYSTFQDAARWLNEGWVDMITAMSYHWLTGREMKDHLESDWFPNITKGIADGRFYSPGIGSYLLSTWPQHQNIISAVHTLPWVKGFQFFAYTSWKDSPNALGSSHTSFANKAKHPSYAFLNSDVPAAPTLNMVKNTDSSYTMTITPDVGVSKAQWFVIYRKNTSAIDVDSSEIVEVVFSDSVFTYDVNFDGLQLTNTKYYYAVSMCSRYWIESALSTVVNTDNLPLLPPQVIAHDPVSNETGVPNNQVVRVEFNKNMDAASIADHLTITPTPANISLQWDNPTWVKDDHLILNVSASWMFNTTYTVNFAASTIDQVNMQIDGNKDGSGGDAYSFAFTISGADEEAPVIAFNYPSQGDFEIDTDLPVSIIFNERLDYSTLVDRLKFYYGDYSITPYYTAYTGSDSRTYMNVKPKSFFPSNSVVTLELLAGITDTAGNAMDAQSISFKTDSSYYANRKMIDNFMGAYEWKTPTYSGSTSGINSTSSSSTIQSTNRVSGFAPDYKALRIVLVPTQADWFARVHNADLKNNANLDTSMILQAYIYGDGSGYKFRFSINEREGANSFEVSTWFTVDWTGWKLVEWDIHDPSQFGVWGSMTGGSLDGTSYGFESLQFMPGTENPEAPITVYIDQLRMIDKREGTYPENYPPVIEAISDTMVAPSTGVYYYADYSDLNPGDILTLFVIPDTSAIAIRRYSSPAEKFRLKADGTYEGTSHILVIVKDNGVGELADTAEFDMIISTTAVEQIPETFKVYPNYPNPFNPVTTLRFDLPSSDKVRIEIFNTRGQRVALLADSHFEAGSWNLNFDASYLSSGVYFYKITAGENIAVNRMTLLK